MRQSMYPRQAVRAREAGNGWQAIALFARPMVSPDFAYSPLGALTAIGVAGVIASVLYAFTLWPLDTVGWLAFAAFARFVGRGPIDSLFK
jgi:hypothetical protein